MLVVVSDLHLNDGSAAPENVKAGAFAIWMADVLALARQNQAKELVFLYLGDMVDLLRTEYWFYPKPDASLDDREFEGFPLEDRPWGNPRVNEHPDEISAACRKRALQILQKIAQSASEQLKYLRGDSDALKTELDALGIPVRRLYVPGNHDRLFWVDPHLRQAILALFGANQIPGLRPFELKLPEYGLLARHGHEWDPWNYEAFEKGQEPADLRYDLYKLVPIGDPITTELLARLPFLVARSLPPEIPDAVRAQVYEQLRHVEDVRPLSEALRWVLVSPDRVTGSYDDATRTTIATVLSKVVKQVVADFMHIPFVQAWIAKHDSWNLGLDEADKLQDIYRLSRVLDVGQLEPVLRWFEKLGLMEQDDDSKPALREIGDPPRACFCVYGHTHAFRHVPIGRNAGGDDLVYLNSGTWRPRVMQAKDGKDFVSFKEMTYLVFYRSDEDLGSQQGKSPSYELWNGVMNK